MKNLMKGVLLLMVMSLFSCHSYRYDDDGWQLPCERDQTGNVCFDNDTHRRVKVDIGNTEFEVEAYSTICVDVYEGDQNYKIKQGLHRWRGTIPVFRCEQYFVELDR